MMKDNKKQERAPSQAIRKLRHPKIQHRHESPFEAKHNSLRKLMEMRILPPLHPQTDVKRTKQPAKFCCPQEFQQVSKEASVLKLGKSEQLLAETPKFSFENIVIKHLQRSPEKMMTISHDQQNSKRKQSQLAITFGKLTKKQEIHRYTEMEDREAKEKRRKPLIQLSNFSRLGKYDSIFRPLLKENVQKECQVIQDRILPPINSKNL